MIDVPSLTAGLRCTADGALPVLGSEQGGESVRREPVPPQSEQARISGISRAIDLAAVSCVVSMTRSAVRVRAGELCKRLGRLAATALSLIKVMPCLLAALVCGFALVLGRTVDGARARPDLVFERMITDRADPGCRTHAPRIHAVYHCIMVNNTM